MPLKVIGAGLPRTGTFSLKLALEQVGLGPCQHMTDLISSPAIASRWARVYQGLPTDWEEVFAGFQSAVDFPASDCVAKLAAFYDTAKVILTVRDVDAWYASTQATVFAKQSAAGEQKPVIAEIMRTIAQRRFGGQIHDRDVLVDAYETHQAEVKRIIPKERLLLYAVAEGWGPLCRFLGVRSPGGPFPWTNSSSKFIAEADLYQKR